MSSKLTPLNPSIVMCCEQPIMAVQLPDGPIAATPLSFCQALHLNYSGQLQRIRRNESLDKYLRLVPIQTNVGVRKVDVLIIEGIPRWLSTLQVSRLAPEKQPLARALQQQAEDTLARYFSEEAVREAAPPNQTAEPPRSSRQMTHKAFERLHQVADALHQVADELDEDYTVTQEKIEAMGDHIVALEAEMASLKQEPPRNARWQTTVNPVPSDGPRLSKDHLYQAYALACDERRRSGQRVDRLLRELAEAFGVEDMSDIPDAGWEEVAAWFWERRQRH
ncbi:MAG TPA: phage antirepressor N-terminal domain-containing protein [Ktedonobacterales bacterium]|nr:phage antirepressor N-terminal domain-containing protein [Ktedonobacterales bacterium]